MNAPKMDPINAAPTGGTSRASAGSAPTQTPPADNELELVTAARGGDVSAFETLVNRYERKIFRLGMNITGSREDAEDVMQEAFLKAYEPVSYTHLDVYKRQPLLLRHLHEVLSATRTVMVGMEAKEEHFFQSVREGAAGYVLQEASAAEVLGAIHSVAAGEAVCPACFSATLFRCASQLLTMRENLRSRGPSELSRREQQLVELVCGGDTNKEIASRLHLSAHTVKNHIYRILKKTGASCLLYTSRCV